MGTIYTGVLPCIDPRRRLTSSVEEYPSANLFSTARQSGEDISDESRWKDITSYAAGSLFTDLLSSTRQICDDISDILQSTAFRELLTAFVDEKTELISGSSVNDIDISFYWDLYNKYLSLLEENEFLKEQLISVSSTQLLRSDDLEPNIQENKKLVLSSEYDSAVRRAIEEKFPKVKKINFKQEIDKYDGEDYFIYQVISKDEDYGIIYSAIGDIVEELAKEYHELVVRTKIVYNNEWY